MTRNAIYLAIIGSAIMMSACGKKQEQQPQQQPAQPQQQHSVTDHSSVAIPTAPQPQNTQGAMPQPQYFDPNKPQQQNNATSTVDLTKKNQTAMPTGPIIDLSKMDDDNKPATWLRIGISNKIVASVDKNTISKNASAHQVTAKVKYEFPHSDFTVRDTVLNKEYHYKTMVSKMTIECNAKQFKVTKTSYFDAQNAKLFAKATPNASNRAVGKDNMSSQDILTGLCKF